MNMNPTMIEAFEVEDGTIELWQINLRAYLVRYPNGATMTGTFREVVEDLQETYKVFDK